LTNKYSISRSLHYQTIRYLELYKITLKDIKRKKDLHNLIDSIFFFWIKTSSDKNYLWSKSSVSLYFLNEQSDIIKKIIELKIIKHLTEINSLKKSKS
jgi:hypothetical protein